MLTSIKNRKRNKTSNTIQWRRFLGTTGMLSILIVIASFCITHYINRREEARSLQRLYRETSNIAENIQSYAEDDQKELEILSAAASQFQDLSSPELWRLLSSHTNIGMISRIELLLPGNIVLTKEGKRVDANGLLSFEEEAAKGAHITNREADILHADTYIIRHYVPVRQKGKIVAMLYGVINLDELPENLNLDPYAGRGALYIIEGNTGNFLVNTWHTDDVENIWALGDRKMALDYSPEQLKQGITSGASQYVIFISETIGEYLYFYYEPMTINDWRIAVSVPKSVLFESANTTRHVLYTFLGFELVCFAAYFLWIMHYIRNVTREKQTQLDMLNHMYGVEQLLFNAHRKEANVYASLEKLGSIISAEKVSFWILDADKASKWYFWEMGQPAGERREPDGQEYIEKLLKFFADGNEAYESFDEDEIRDMFPAKELSDIYNIMAVPVESADGHILGILAVCNVKEDQESAVLLKNIQFSFSMLCSNLRNYTEIQEQRDRDTLTGLYNRNRYERDLPQIYAQYKNSLACVYIDANGLRELNNTTGHDKGDEMLRKIAEKIEKYFDTEYIYRTGGDEFVLFIPGADESDLNMRSEDLISSLSEDNYYISVGIQCDQHISSISPLVKKAEQKMYAEKKKYYEKHDRRRNPGARV